MSTVRRALKYAGSAVVLLVVLVVLAYLLGVLGLPTVTGVENRFGAVNETSTEVVTDLHVNNPNPIGIRLGDTAVDYTVAMNEVEMARGHRTGLDLQTGDSTLHFRTYLQNDRIPDWWYTHVRGGEVTELVVDARLTGGYLFGRSVGLETNETIRTDLLGEFDTNETRSIDAGLPLVSDPVLYVNETVARYGDPLTRTRTPIETAFTVYNPKPFPYRVTEIGYEVRMNDVVVGTGGTDRAYTILPGTPETLRATTTIDNENLDEWWVTHVRNDQVTEVVVDFYIVVQPDIAGRELPPIRIDVDAFDYSTTIETDVFGTDSG